MASFVQSRLQKIKPSAKNVIEKYKEVLEQALKELKTPDELKQGLETFLAASKNTKLFVQPHSIIEHKLSHVHSEIKGFAMFLSYLIHQYQ